MGIDAFKRFLRLFVNGILQNRTAAWPVVDLLKSMNNRESHQCSSLSDCLIFGILFWLINYCFNSLIMYWIVDAIGNHTYTISFMYFIFYGFFIIPLLICNKLLSAIWFQDIANVTISQTGIRRNASVNYSEWIADLVKSLLLQVCFYLQGYCIYFFPVPLFMQHVWYLFHLALLSSLYAFEYKWVHMGWQLERRLLFIAKRWPFFLGYGLPLSLVTILVGSFTDSMIVYATVFPVYIVSSINTVDNNSPVFSHYFNIFQGANMLSDLLIKFFNQLPYRAIFSKLCYIPKFLFW